MKKIVSIILFCLFISAVCIGCGKQSIAQEPTSQITAIGNPWKDWNSIEEAVDAMVHARRIYQPNRENKDCYDELLIRYRQLMTLTKESEEYL